VRDADAGGTLRKGAALWVTMAALAGLLATSPASAQQPERASTERAEQLFEEGKREFDAGRLEPACASLAESDRLDPHVGTLGLLAACHEKRGQLAAAHRAYRETADRARATGDDRERFANESALALERKLGRVTVHVSGERGRSTVAIGPDLQSAEAGSTASVFVDPGSVEIEVSSAAQLPWRRVLHVEPGTHVHLEVPALPAAPIAKPKQRADEGSSRGLPPLAYGAGAAALAGLGIGTGFGIAAIARADDADPFCDEQDQCTARGGAIREDARTLARVSTVGFAAGAVGVGVAVAAWLTAPDDAPKPRASGQRVRVAPMVAPSSAGATLRGAF
jgi:hypothetical protein